VRSRYERTSHAGWPVIICACCWPVFILRTTRNGKQVIYEPRDERVFCILVDMIGHVVKPPSDDDE